jgi:hypothetical protein
LAADGVPQIPWEEPSRWLEAQWALDRLARQHRRALGNTHRRAADLRRKLYELFPVMEALGRETCTCCARPCCRTARVWYDFRDLLLYRLTGVPLPACQPASCDRGGCRFLTSTGCSVERGVRPWICTWYLCPVQKRALSETGPRTRRAVLSEIEAVGRGRKRLEAEFLAVVTRCGG